MPSITASQSLVTLNTTKSQVQAPAESTKGLSKASLDINDKTQFSLHNTIMGGSLGGLAATTGAAVYLGGKYGAQLLSTGPGMLIGIMGASGAMAGGVVGGAVAANTTDNPLMGALSGAVTGAVSGAVTFGAMNGFYKDGLIVGAVIGGISGAIGGATGAVVAKTE